MPTSRTSPADLRARRRARSARRVAIVGPVFAIAAVAGFVRLNNERGSVEVAIQGSTTSSEVAVPGQSIPVREIEITADQRHVVLHFGGSPLPPIRVLATTTLQRASELADLSSVFLS